MPGFFSRLKGKDGAAKKDQQQQIVVAPQKPTWTDAWTRTSVEPEEIQELLRGCTLELKSKALDVPFFLLPFRPTSDPSAARTFIRNFFDSKQHMRGDYLAQELRLTGPMVLCSVVKWCWSRLAGGVVSWDAYELFRTGEHDSNMARDSFATFIPLSVDSDARTKIIFDFFELLAAIAAHGKSNGLGGRKLSRLAGWWAFEHNGTENGFDGGYKGWTAAADATSHLFFAYLRSMSPESTHGIDGINTLPRSLQKLVAETEYPPQTPSLMLYTTPKVVMVVDSVSPTPFALLRRANNFQYRDQDAALQQFSNFEDPVKALTDECRRVLRSISNSNQTTMTSQKNSSGVKEASWSRFEDIGFSGAFDETEEDEDRDGFAPQMRKPESPKALRSTPASGTVDTGRPTTPSWADFLSSGFVEDQGNAPSPLLLPPDKILLPVETLRGRSSQSHRPRLESERDLEPGELASISTFDLDESFWWVWISSLAGEEPAQRKAAFGRCALVETIVPQGKWIVIEEQVKGAAPEPAPGAYVAEKKNKFWSRRGKSNTVTRSKSNTGKPESANPAYLQAQNQAASKTSIGQDQHARIQRAAAALQQKQRQAEQPGQTRRGREGEDMTKTNSVMTLQPADLSELSPAMKWANKYDKEATREQYLANNKSGKGAPVNGQTNGNGHASRAKSPEADRDLPAVPHLSAKSEMNLSKQVDNIMAPAAVPPAPLPPTPAAEKQTYTGNVLTDKQIEAGVSAKAMQETHPAERERPSTPLPLRMKGDSESSHLITPPRKTQQQSLAQFLSEGEPPKDAPVRPSVESPDRHKLKKKTGSSGNVTSGVTSGFKGIFGRKKNRNSLQMASEPAATSVYAVQAPPAPVQQQKENVNPNQGLQAPTMKSRFGSFRKKSSPVVTPLSEKPASRAPDSIREHDDTPARSSTPQQQQFERSYDPSVNGSQSRLDTADAHEARQEFGRFDQGPMDDMPAFVPEPEIEDERLANAQQQARIQHQERRRDASPISPALEQPPVVVPHRGPAVDPKNLTGMLKPAGARKPVGAAAEKKEEVVAAEAALTPAQDRWAQIRKQAAERAAARSSEDRRTTTSDGDGETDDGETIEARVARIKARVAELTGNMEDGANGSRTHSPARR